MELDLNKILDNKVNLDEMGRLKEDFKKLLKGDIPLYFYSISFDESFDNEEWKEIIESMRYRHKRLSPSERCLDFFVSNREIHYTVELNSPTIHILRPTLNHDFRAENILSGGVRQLIEYFFSNGLLKDECLEKYRSYFQELKINVRGSIFNYDWKNREVTDTYTSPVSDTEVFTDKYQNHFPDDVIDTLKKSYKSILGTRYSENVYFSCMTNGKNFYKSIYDAMMIRMVRSFYEGKHELSDEYVSDFMDIFLEIFNKYCIVIDRDYCKKITYNDLLSLISNLFLSVTYEIQRIMGTHLQDECYADVEYIYHTIYGGNDFFPWDKYVAHINSTVFEEYIVYDDETIEEREITKENKKQFLN